MGVEPSFLPDATLGDTLVTLAQEISRVEREAKEGRPCKADETAAYALAASLTATVRLQEQHPAGHLVFRLSEEEAIALVMHALESYEGLR